MTGVGVVGCAVHAYDTVDSTQAVLARLVREDAPEGTVVTARHQTGGRGSRGRGWWDSPGESLLISVLLKPSMATVHVPQLSLVAGLAVAEALATGAGVAARIRWPNDVLVGGRKICGVLPEAASGADGRVAYVLLGIGLNVNQSEFPRDLAPHATSLRLVTGATQEQGRLLATLLETLERRYRDWLHGGFPSLREAWRRSAATLGERVRIPDGREGLAVDVDDTGALLVDAGEGTLIRMVSAAA